MRIVVKARAGQHGGPELDAIAGMPGVEMIDRIDDHAALIEASDEVAEKLAAMLPGFVIAPETSSPPPQPPVPRPGWDLRVD